MIHQFVLVLAMTIFPVTNPPQKDAGKKELEQLQGTWVLVGGESKGDVLTEKEARAEKHSIVIKGDKAVLIEGETQDTCTLRLNPTKNPAWIDLVYLTMRGKKADGVNHAIYSLNGDKLTICASNKYNPNSTDDRPIKVTSDRTENTNLSGLGLFIYKREKK